MPTSNGTILVHVLSSDVQLRETLNILFRLEGHETVASEHRDAFEAEVDRRQPDVVILDSGKGSRTLDTLQSIRSRGLVVPTILLCDRSEFELAVASMKTGATDVLPKPIDKDRLLKSVRGALEQMASLGPFVAGQRVIEVTGFRELSSRQRGVLQQVINGVTSREIARELGISLRTVEAHRAGLMEKLDARNTADLIRIVVGRLLTFQTLVRGPRE